MAFIAISDAKVELEINNTTYDALLTPLVSAVLSIWDELTGRTWAQAAFTEYYSAPAHQNMLLLRQHPVASSPAVQMWDDPDWEWGSDTLVAAADYRVDEVTGIIYYNSNFHEGKQSIKVSYTAGYTDAGVPEWLKRILVRQVAVWFQQARNREWHLSSKATPEGGSISFSNLKNNLLVEFVDLARRHKRMA